VIIFDLDGTLVDLWPRYWSVFKDILNLDISLSAYKSLKQSLKDDRLLANYLGCVLPKDYFEKKRIFLESNKYLIKDRLFFEAEVINKFLENDSFILTKRRNYKTTISQINELGIKGKVICIDSCSKISWLKDNVDGSKEFIIVGDSYEELDVAKLENASAYMVGYGLLKYEDYNKKNLPFEYFDDPFSLQIALSNIVD